MQGPDEAVSESLAYGGEIHDEPSKIISVVVTDESDKPAGVLEKWSSAGWIYCPADDLKSLE
jgi:hypothetical protein